MIIAKKQSQEVVDGYYELYKPATMTGIEGEEVQVLQSIGTYSIEQLNQEKDNYEAQIVSIEEKITAINNLK